MAGSNPRIDIPQVNANTADPDDLPRIINQLQQNIIDAFAKLQIKYRALTSSIGDTVLSPLTLSQFQAQRGTGWILSDGTNIQGSQFQKITGSIAVPDQVANFTDVFPYIRIN